MFYYDERNCIGPVYFGPPGVGSESRFLPTPPAFDAPVRGVPVGILSCCLVVKN